MLHLIDAFRTRFTDNNVVQLAEHVFHGNTFRASRARTEGASVIIGRISNRDERSLPVSGG